MSLPRMHTGAESSISSLSAKGEKKNGINWKYYQSVLWTNRLSAQKHRDRDDKRKAVL